MRRGGKLRESCKRQQRAEREHRRERERQTDSRDPPSEQMQREGKSRQVSTYRLITHSVLDA
jgi:hypothetical protein